MKKISIKPPIRSLPHISPILPISHIRGSIPLIFPIRGFISRIFPVSLIRGFISPKRALHVLNAFLHSNRLRRWRAIALLFLIAAASMILRSAEVSKAGWFDEDFHFRQIFTIGNSGVADSFKKVKLDINTANLIEPQTSNYNSYEDTFTPAMSKRNVTGAPFAAGVMVQGKSDTSLPDQLTVTRGSQIAGDFYANYDADQGSIVVWITPEWNGNDNLPHSIWMDSGGNISLWKNSDNTLVFRGNSADVAVNVSGWTAGTTYNVVVRWDSRNNLSGSNYASISINGVHAFGQTVFTQRSPSSTYYIGSFATAFASNALIEGLTIYRRPLYEATTPSGINVGNGDELSQIYGGGTAPKDPTLITGSWDVVLALPTNSSTGQLTTGNGNAWSHPHSSNKLYTSTTNTGGFMMNGTASSDGWAEIPWYKVGGASGVVAAYQPIGATDLANSYINKANPGTYNAAPGVAPTWAVADGWTFDGSTQYLTTGYNPPQAFSAIVRFAGGTTGNYRTPFGGLSGAQHYSVLPIWFSTHYYQHGDTQGLPGEILSGVMAVTPNQGYLNGAPEGPALTGMTGPAISPALIGCYSNDGTPTYWWNGSIQATAIYNATMTAPQVANVTDAMEALGSGGTYLTISPLATAEKIYAGGYKFTSSGAYQGISNSFTATSGGDYVVRALGHSDGTCAPQVKVVRADGVTEVTHLNGTTASTRTAPDSYIFTFESPAAESLSVQLLNTAATGTCYFHQVEVLSNLIDNPSAEGTYSGGLAPGKTSGGTITPLESASAHSGSKAQEVDGGAGHGLSAFVATNYLSNTVGAFFSSGTFLKRTSGSGQSSFRWQNGFLIIQNGSSTTYFDTTSPTYSFFPVVLRGAYSSYPFFFYNSDGSTNLVTDDTYHFQLTDVSLTVTPASEANSLESSGLRVDGLDTLTMPLTNLTTTEGTIKFKYTPRHSAADVAKFGNSTPYILDAYGNASNYIRVYWSAANTVTLAFNDGAGERAKTWDATGAIVAGTTYSMKVAYTSNSMTFSVDDVAKITFSASTDWWAAGGATGAVAAYQPIGAADYTTSKINLANPGTYNAGDGSAYPTFASGTGWTFNGSTQYLTTGIAPVTSPQTWSVLVRFSDVSSGRNHLAVGAGAVSAGFGVGFWSGSIPTSNMVLGVNGAYAFAGTFAGSGVIGVAGNRIYQNGSDVGATGLAAVNSSTMYIGGLNNTGLTSPFLGSIQSLAIYNTTLTAPQVAAVTTAMQALGISFDTTPTTAYYGSKQDGTLQNDATFAAAALPATSYKLKADCSDIRFTDINGKLLDYYFDSAAGPCNTTSSDFWVLVPQINSGNTEIHAYYGNPSASSASKSSQFTQATFTPTSGPTSAGEEKGGAPIAIWHMNEATGGTAYDATSNRNDMTLGVGSSAPSWDVQGGLPSGGVGQPSLRFDGSTDYASRASDTDFNFGSDPFSISGWFRHPSSVSSIQYLVSSYSTAGYKIYMTAAGLVCFGADDDSSWGPDYSACTVASYADSAWHYLEAIKGSDSLKLYIDGIEKASTILNTNYNIQNTGALILGMDNTGTSFWDGYLDEFYVYNYARSAAEVKIDYNMRSSVSAGSGSVSSSGSTGGSSLSNGLVGYWKMDESASPSLDSSGNGNSGTWNGNVAPATGKFGIGASFDGAGDYVSMGDPATGIYDFDTTSSFSISTWVKTSDTGAVAAEIVNKYAPSPAKQYVLYLTATNRYAHFDLYDGSFQPQIQGTTNLADNNWHQITAVRDVQTDKLYLYVDGVSVATAVTDTTTNTLANGGALTVGALSGGASQFYTGRTDEVRIYSRALSSSEVRALYEFAPGPVAHWKFDEGSGESVADVSGNSNTGTLGTGSSAPSWKTGKYGKGLSFDGGGDYISTTDTNFPTGSSAKTMEAWFKTSASLGTNIWGVIYNYGTGATNKAFTIAVSSSSDVDCSIANAFSVSQYGDAFCGTTAVNDNLWHHGAVSYNGTIYSLYVDGVLQKTGSMTTDTTKSVSYMGQFITGGLNFNGLIDDVRIYNYARSQAQIVEDMRAGEPAPGADSSPVGESGRPAAPIAYYRFDEGADNTCTGGVNDACNQGSGGIALDGAQSGMSVPATPTSGWTNNGKFSKALVFDGNGDYVNLGTGLDQNGELTISAWINTASVAAGTKTIVSNCSSGGGNQDYSFEINRTAGKINILWGNTFILTGTTSLTSGTWYHTTVIRSGSSGAWTAKLYLNGVLDGSTTTVVNPNATNEPTTVGRAGGYNGAYFTGSIDEVKIYNFPLTPDQVKLEYNQGSAMVMGEKIDAEDSGYDAQDKWWKAPSGVTAVAAYDAVGATSLADSYTNEANPGTYTAAPGVAPTWSAGTGWTFNGTTQYLTTGVVPASDNWSMIVRFSNATNTYATLAGLHHAGITYFTLSARDATYGVLYGQGGIVTALPAETSGVLAIAGHQGYRNGVANGAPTGAWANTTLSIFVGCRNLNGTPYNFGAENIQSLAIYSGTLTASDVATITSNMNNLGGETPPVADWKLDENSGQVALDTSGNANTGQLGSTSGVDASDPSWKPGKSNSGLQFDGVNDYVSLGDSSILESHTGASGVTTISAWVKPTNFTNPSTIIGKYNNGGLADTREYVFSILNGADAGKLNFSIYDSSISNYDSVKSTNSLTASVWSHVVVVFDNTQSGITNKIKLFINGKQETGARDLFAGTFSSMPDTSVNLGIGAHNLASPVNVILGLIDQVKIYNYARTPAQIAYDYNGGAPVAHYRFDECSGPIVYSSNSIYSSSLNGTITMGAGNGQTVPGTCNTSGTAWGNGSTGKYSASLNFDGDDFVNVGTSLSINTASFWVKPTSTTASMLGLSGTSYITANSGPITATGFSSPTYYVNGLVSSSPTLTANVWNHILVTTTTAINTANPFTIGKANGAYTAGQMDDVKLFNYVLSADQVKLIYNENSSVRWGSP